MGAHAFYKSGIFLCAGIILLRRFGFQDIRGVAKGGEGFIFFLCSLGVILVPTFFSKHIVFSFTNETNLSVLLGFTLSIVFLMWTTVSFFIDYSGKVIKARGVLEVFLVLLLTWNLGFHRGVDLSSPFNWATMVFLGVLLSLKGKFISNSRSLTVYQNYFIGTKSLWYEAKIWFYYMGNR